MKRHLYNEVYVVGTDNTVSTSGELTVCDSLEDLLTYLKSKNISINPDLRVLHGVLTPATVIPKDLKGRQPFILLVDPDSVDHGIILDSDTEDSCAELASEIEEILNSEEGVSFFFEMENVFILYGYELSLTLSIDEDDIDEEIVSDCLEIGKAAKNLSKKEEYEDV
jgi:hypothetical protein